MPRVCLLGAALLLCLAAEVAHAGEGRAPNGHRVRWDAGLDAPAARVLRELPAVAAHVERALGFALVGAPAEVVLVRSLARAREELGAGVPDWAAGAYSAGHDRLVLRLDLTEQAAPLRTTLTTLRHEWVHLSWRRRAGALARRLPLWVEEGLAEDIGGGISVDGGAQLDFAARFNWLIPFAEIAEAWPLQADRAALAYRQGRSFVEYLRAETKPDVWPTILRDLAEGRGADEGLGAGTPFEALVLEHTGGTVSHWLSRWRIKVEEEADPWFHLLLRDFTGTIFLGLAVASAIGYLFMRRRRRRQMAELPDLPFPDEAS